MKKLLAFVLGFAFVTGFIPYSSAQQTIQKKLTLEDLYKNNVFRQKGINAIRWMKDNTGYSVLETNKEIGAKDIVRYDAKTGDSEVLVSAGNLIPTGEKAPLEISNYAWTEDNNKLLIFTNTRKVWRYHTRGDYWVLDLQNGALTQIGASMEPARLMFAKFSPDGKNVGFVYKNNIYVQSLETGAVEQLTFDGNDRIINGTFDWVYEEELNCRDGFRWSPDSKKISFWQMDTKGMGTFYLINNIDSIYPKIIPLPYPKVGTTNSSAKIGSITLDDKLITWMDIPGDPRNNYLARMDWANSSDELIIQQLNRQQNTNKVFFANAANGTAKVVYTEKVETWLDIHDDLTWLNKGKEFTWFSDQTGWLHLNRVSRENGKITPITSGDFEVVGLSGIDLDDKWAYYIASPDNATQRYLFRNRMDGKGKQERLSPANQTGHHSYSISPDCKYAIHTFSNHNTPTRYEVITLPDHKVLRVLEDNKELNNKLAEYTIPEKEFFKIKTDDGLEFDAWMIKPVHFNPEKKYPLIFYIYGEPAGSTVQDSWSSNLWDQLLAQEGYIVMSIDNRGTNTPRGRDWRKCVYKKIGITAPEDQAACARKILEWDFVDPDRIGIWGWSGGGSNTLNCMFRHPEIYKTGIAIAFISNQLLYDNIYQERYMNLPENNVEGYRDGSPITHAKKLEGNLLLIHGSGDDNCHYQSCEMLVNELIKQNKYFSMVEYPMRTHSINERENTSLHLRMTMLNYFKKNLPLGAK
ncbi:S9 family peptidase [Maribellus maritimus]|uniref:S9 family peptidase n=1 Tax=Maribellus maritimus TaxID=2870838 RepID=UPI001EEC21A4|nr:S9 family peptidase [Maribellus maritimus]MCG6186324.1 S9 family peptidase [Maribellus maritimus]